MSSPIPGPKAPLGFEALGLRPELLQALTDLGYEEPTPVQRAALPALLSGRDVVGQAATGTGKTAAFALPLLQRLGTGSPGPHAAWALVVVPTRELALQVAEAIHAYGRNLKATVVPIYGGQPLAAQVQRLRRGADVVVATPGRALDHLRRKTLVLDRVRTVVLDEADEMLDLGFADDLEILLAALPAERQTALFSATMPPRIAAIAGRHLRDPLRLRVDPHGAAPGSLPKIRQLAFVVPKAMKEVALGRLLDVETPRSALIFCRTRVETSRLALLLASHGHDVAELHGGLTQEQRAQVLRRFKAHKLRLLVATDVAARGLDVDELSHVINFDPPSSPEAYVHRIGRTGRAGKEGRAITFLESRELRILKSIEALTKQPIEVGQPPSTGDLRDRRLAITRAKIDEALKQSVPAPFRALAAELSQRSGPEEALAATLAALHAELHPARPHDEAEIPAFRPTAPRDRPRAPAPPSAAVRKPPPRPSQGVRLFIGLGSIAGLRPADLVGAIANEAGLAADEIGAIKITERHSIVEVPSERADRVIAALQRSTLRGRKVKVDRDRGANPRPTLPRPMPPRRG